MGGLLYAFIGTAVWFASVTYGDLTNEAFFGTLLAGSLVLCMAGVGLGLFQSIRRLGSGVVVGAILAFVIETAVVSYGIASVTY